MLNIVKCCDNVDKLNFNKVKEVKTVRYDSFDLFYFYELILFRGCRSPPNPFNFTNLKLNGGIKMNDNSKCFIKIGQAIFEEITYKELKSRREKFDTYKTKRFIPVQGMLIEVSDEEYRDFYREVEVHKYHRKLARNYKWHSLDALEDDEDIRDKNVIADENVNIEAEIERKTEIKQLKKALLSLDKDEYELIKTIFYDEETIHNYARKSGIPYSTLQYKKQKVLEKLKKFMKN